MLDGDGQPLGGFWDGEPAAPGPRAYGYRYDGSRGQIGEFEGPFWSLEANGGVGMTTLEMAEWTRALWTGRILSPGAMEMLAEVKHQTEFQVAELAGWGELRIPDLKERVFSASGGGSSIAHQMDTYWLPDTNRVFVIATSAKTEMTRVFAEDMLNPLLNETGIPTPVPVVEADQATVEAMVGTYLLDGSDERFTVKTRENGLLIQSSGPVSQGIILPLLPAMDSEAERHEQLAVELLKSDSEVQRELTRIETESGPISDVTVMGTICCGLITMFELQFADGATGALGLTVVDGQINDGRFDHPERFVVYQEDGSYRPYRPDPQDNFQIMVSGTTEQPTLEIVNINGTFTATKLP